MTTGYLLSAADRDALRADIRAESVRTRNTTGRPRLDLDDTVPAPEVYVAKTPVGGIAALNPGHGTGTGVNDEPGWADCSIYRVARETSPPSLLPITSLTKRVYNLGSTAIAGSTWVQVIREKAGAWLAVVAAGAAARTFGRIDGVYDWQGTFLYSWTQMQRGTPWGWTVKPSGIVGLAEQGVVGTGTVSGPDTSFQAAQEFNNNDSVSVGKVVEMIPGYLDPNPGGRGQTYFFFYPKALVDISATMGCGFGVPTWTPIKTFD